MAAKQWSDDFRSDAISASITMFPGDIPDDIHDGGQSFCLPMRDRPMVGFTPGKLMLIILALGISLMGLAAWVISSADGGADELGDPMPVIVGMMLGISGLMCFFVPAVCDKPIAKWFLGSRGKELQQRAGSDSLMSAELANGDPNKQEIAVDADDNVLFFADKLNQRLLIEGLAARYQIRSEDVLAVQPFLYTNYVGASIHYRINGQTDLLIALARVSLLYELTRQLPFLRFLRKRIKNRILDEVSQAIEPPILMAEIIDEN